MPLPLSTEETEVHIIETTALPPYITLLNTKAQSFSSYQTLSQKKKLSQSYPLNYFKLSETSSNF